MTGATQLDAQSSYDFAANIAQTDSTNVFNLGPDGLIFELPYKRIKTLNTITDGGTPDYNFRFETNRIHSATGDVTSGSAIFTTAVANEVFGSKSLNTNWILVNDDGSGLTDNPPVDDMAEYVFSNANQTVTVSGLSSYEGDSLRLIAPMVRTLDHKTKTLSGNTSVNFNAGVSYAGTGQQLGHADIHTLVSVTETSGGADVTEHFNF